MSFWNLNDSTEQLNTTGNFETGGGDIAPIPAKTQVKAAIDEAKWDMTQDGDEYISLRHTVLAPAEYKNRKVFQKLWVMGNNPNNKNPAAQGDKAKRMLAAIAANCGGGLLKVQGKPSDQDLQSNLTGKPMALLLQVWKLEKDDGTTAEGNWVSSVSPLRQQSAPPPQVQQQAPTQDFDADVGF
jgi:hypothetical protein